jgi:hypothetical protein
MRRRPEHCRPRARHRLSPPPRALAVPIHCCPWAVIEANPCFASSLPARPPQLSSVPLLPPRSASMQTGTSSHGTASPTPPRAPPVLRTSLRAMSQAPPPPDDALHAVSLRPPTHRRGARSTVSFSPLQPLNRAPPLVGLLLDLFPHVRAAGSPESSGAAASLCCGSASPVLPVGCQTILGWAGQKRPKCTVIFCNFQLN